MQRRLLVAAALALVAVFLGWAYMRSFEARVSGGRMVAVLAAAKELAPGTRVSEAELATRNIPEAYLHPESVLAASADEKKIMGRAILVRVAQGQPLLWSDFEDRKGKLGKGLAGAVQKGQRAYTVPVDVSGSFASQVRPGDRVDVLGTFNRKDQEATITILQNVLVLSVAGKKEEHGSETGFVVGAVTLSLALDEAELMVFAMQHGVISFVLRGEEDIDVVTDVGQKNFGDLLEEQKRTAMAQRRVKRGPTALKSDQVPQ